MDTQPTETPFEFEKESEYIPVEKTKSPEVKRLQKRRVYLVIFGAAGLLLIGMALSMFKGGTEKEEAPELEEISVLTPPPDIDQMMEDSKPKDTEKSLLKDQAEDAQPEYADVLDSKSTVDEEEDKTKKEIKAAWEREKIQSAGRYAKAAYGDGFSSRRSKIFVAQNEKKRSDGFEGQTPSTFQPQQRRADGFEGQTPSTFQPQQRRAGGDVDSRNAFFKEDHTRPNYNFNPLLSVLSKYEIKAGTLIRLVLETAINSDQPGFIKARFTEPLYDTVSGNYLLVPSGTVMLGEYNAEVKFGQSRVQVSWTRMIMPNGDSQDIGNLPGVDLSGASGLSDEVDGHWDKILGAALLTSVLSGTAAAAKGTQNTGQIRPEQAALTGLSESAQDTGKEIIRKQLEVAPTITIRAGHEVAAFVKHDLILKPYSE